MPLQHGNADFLGGAGVDRRFVDDRGALFQAPGHCFRGIDQRPKVGIVRGIDGRRHGDNDEIRVSEQGGVGGELEPVRRAKLVGGNFARGVDSSPEGIDPCCRIVVAQGAEALAELDGQRQPDIAQADHGDGFLVRAHTASLVETWTSAAAVPASIGWAAVPSSLRSRSISSRAA